MAEFIQPVPDRGEASVEGDDSFFSLESAQARSGDRKQGRDVKGRFTRPGEGIKHVDIFDIPLGYNTPDHFGAVYELLEAGVIDAEEAKAMIDQIAGADTVDGEEAVILEHEQLDYPNSDVAA